MAQAQGMQFARLVMSHIDCDTIPFFWNFANRFTIFDSIFATEDTPSTPNAIAMIAGQSGETQWVKHAGETPAAAADQRRRSTARPIRGPASRSASRSSTTPTRSGAPSTTRPPAMRQPTSPARKLRARQHRREPHFRHACR